MRQGKFDFAVKYDPDKDTSEDIATKILYSLVIKRIKNKKPCVMFIGGDSGEGKSTSALKIQEILMKAEGLELNDFVDDVNVYSPIQYPEKMDSLLTEKRLKKVRFIAVHEARDLIRANNWASFLSQSISDVNAMSRAVKPLGIMIISQFIRDITKQVRYTINLYITVSRPLDKKARMKINIVYKDDTDLENPKIRRRRLKGYLVYPDGSYRKYVPEYFEISKPSKEVMQKFITSDTEAKGVVIKRKLNKLVDEMRAEIGEEGEKLQKIIEHYSKSSEDIMKIGKRRKGEWKLNKEIVEMHGLSKPEVDVFQKRIYEKLEKYNVIEENAKIKRLQEENEKAKQKEEREKERKENVQEIKKSQVKSFQFIRE